jgi:hypothetical protein
MDPKTYEKLLHVNYGGTNCNITPKTLTADFTEFESVWARLHQFFLHDWGVVSGLQVQATLGAADLRVQAGIAIDRKGNLIVLSTGGSGVLGDAPPLIEAPVPVIVPTAPLISQKYLLTIQWREKHRSVPAPPDFSCGKQEQTPQLRLQPVTGFTDSDDYVCLAVVELDTGGVVKSVNAQDSAAPLGRRRLGETVGALRFEASMNSNPAGTVQEVPAAALEPLPAGNGLQVTAALTALMGKLCLAPTSATLPSDLPGSTVVLSNTQGGGGGVKTLDANGKVMAAFTTTGTGDQQAGYVTVGTAAGSEIVSLGASATGTGQIQVQTRAGKPAVVLSTTGPADDGMVHVLSNNQDVVTLGPAGISSNRNISANGWITTNQVVKASGQVQCDGALIANGGAVAKAGVWTDGNVQCGEQISGNAWFMRQGGMQIRNANNREIASIGFTVGVPDGAFQTTSDGGQPLVRMSTSAKNGWLGLYNQDGKVVASLWSGADKVGNLTISDAAGNAKFSIEGATGKHFLMPHPTEPGKQIT